MSLDNYIDARKKGMREFNALSAKKENPHLIVLADEVPELNRLTQVNLGLCQVALSQIAGTATVGRTSAFSRSFMPLLDVNSEFARKWSDLYDGVLEDGVRQPITAIEYYNKYYVIEGNKRVSVSKYIDSPFIEAEVTRVLPEKEDSERWRTYQEFLAFYDDTKIDYVHFEREGGYEQLCALVGKTPGKKWSGDDLFDFRSCFARFSQAYDPSGSGETVLGISEAFLLYLQVYGYTASKEKTPNEMKRDIDKIRSEYSVKAANKPPALIEQPTEAKEGILQNFLHHPPRVIRCAFIYSRSPAVSGWTYWHELGRVSLDAGFGSHIETTYKENVTPEDAYDVMKALIEEEGYTVIFATSPVFLDACIRLSTDHPECKILNCSLLARYHKVRSYYLRIYEAKYVLGALAGVMADNNEIGYIADYPIYGVPASINAFALGAQSTNPRARVHLEWSTLADSDPERILAEKDIHVISNRDISAPMLDSRAFGLYSEQDGQITNMAMPIWNWSRLYQSVVRSIVTGAWAADEEHNADRVMNYYMGMSTDAIDVVLSDHLPHQTHRLVTLLRNRIRTGDFLPFVGPIYSQDHTLMVKQDEALSMQGIIGMDYLVDNVVGRIPTIDELNDAGKMLVSLQGVEAAVDPAAAENK